MKKLASAIEKDDLKALQKLVNAENINNPDCAHGQSPLIFACCKRKFDITEFLISAGADINKKTSSGNTALIVACDSYEGNSELVAKFVKLLLKNGAKPNIIEKYKNGAIHFAAMYGHVEAVKLLVKNKAIINKKGGYGRTALIFATSSSSSYEMTKFLIEAGANVKAQNDSGDDALSELISREDSNTEIAELLLESGLDVKAKLKSHGTYLHWAAFCGRKNIVELLLVKGAEINSKNNMGNTPVRQAMSQHNTDIVKLLFRNKGKTTSKGFLGWSILEYAVDKKDLDFVNEIIAKYKKDKRKLPTAALIEAARKGDLKTVKILIKAGIPVDDKNNFGSESPLMKAAYYGKLDVVKYLFKQGANINEKNKLNWNALMQACIEGKYSTAKLLLEKASPTDEIDKERGATALSLAKHINRQQLIDLLLSYGAKERPVKRRKKGDNYFSVFDCDICYYIQHKDSLGNTSQIHKFEGLDIIHSLETQPDRYTNAYDWVKKCTICGTYYHHDFTYDDEDSFISGPHISQHIQRYNLHRLKGVLKKLKKEKELKELNKRYNSIIREMQKKITARKKIRKNFLPYVIENLTDYYIMQNDWQSLKSTLLQHENQEIVLQTAYDLMVLYTEMQYKHEFPQYREYRDCPPNIQKKFKPMFKEHYDEIYGIAQKLKNSKDLQTRNKYSRFMYAMKDLNLN